MGCRWSTDERRAKRAAFQRSEQISKTLKQEAKRKKKTTEVEILLIGARNSGKEILLKYLQIMFGETPGVKRDEKADTTPDRLAALSLTLNNIHFKILDVESYLPRNRKLFHYFDSVDAVVFIVDLCSYEKLTDDDPPKNVMKESMELFDLVCNDKFFEGAEKIIHFVNKKEFEEKLKTVPMSTGFPDKTGFLTAENVLQEFIELNRTESIVYTYFTEIHDIESVRFFLTAVKESLLVRSLRQLNQ